MSQIEQYFSGAEELRGIDLSNLVKSRKNLLGSGFFSDVYTVRDEAGNVSPDYVVKALVKGMFVDRFLMNIRRKLGVIQSESSMSIEPNFRAEVAALVDLKGQQIAPNIVYANYKKYYYVIEKMDETLVDMIKRDALTPSQTMKLLALGDRYLRSKYYHDDMHTANIMWSEKLNDFRIIDWGIYLIIKPDTKPSIMLKKENNVFMEYIIWVASLYTQIKIDDGGSNVEEWKAVAEKLSGYIENNFQERIRDYDIFHPEYKYKSRVSQGVRYLKGMQRDYESRMSQRRKTRKGGRKKPKQRGTKKRNKH